MKNLFLNLNKTDLSKEFSDFASTALIYSNDLSDPKIYLIKRAVRGSDPWSGQIALPGGKRDHPTESHLDVAIREVQEEIGHILKPSEFIGELNDIRARNSQGLQSFYVRPLIFNSEIVDKSLDSGEVSDLFHIDLSYFLKKDHHTTFKLTHSHNEIVLPGIKLPSDDILWGMTYMILTDFVNQLVQLPAYSNLDLSFWKEYKR